MPSTTAALRTTCSVGSWPRPPRRSGSTAGMQISADEGVFLQVLTRVSRARRAVEVGTFTGYSALCIARALPPDGTLLCCDVNEEWTADRPPLLGRGRGRRTGSTCASPPPRDAACTAGRPRFDLAFIDADKSSYAAYYEEILARMPAGGLILVDNTIWSGKVLDPRPGRRRHCRPRRVQRRAGRRRPGRRRHADLPRRRDDGPQALAPLADLRRTRGPPSRGRGRGGRRSRDR